MHTDAAGLTQEDVAKRSLHQEYDAYRDHYERMQQVLEAAQLQVHDGEWLWGPGDDLPMDGANGAAPLIGSTFKNSYYLTSTRIWASADPTDRQRDLQPMIDYFTDQGWHIEHRTIIGDREVWATTGDGWQIQYTALGNGDNPITVYSEPFWTNDSNALSTAVYGRSTVEFPHRSLPGVFPPFPDWDDPVVNHPKI